MSKSGYDPLHTARIEEAKRYVCMDVCMYVCMYVVHTYARIEAAKGMYVCMYAYCTYIH